jgi:hypothetical protein
VERRTEGEGRPYLVLLISMDKLDSDILSKIFHPTDSRVVSCGFSFSRLL